MNDVIRIIFVFSIIFLLLFIMININYVLSLINLIYIRFNIVIFAWMVLFLSVIKFYNNNDDSILLNNIVQILIIPVPASIALYLFFKNMNWFRFVNVPIVLLLLYSFFGVLSGVYSPFPEMSIYKSIVIVISLLIGLNALSLKVQPKEVINFTNATYSLYGILLFSYILGTIISPEKSLIEKPLATFNLLSGWIVIANPNTVGFVAGSICILFSNRLSDNYNFKIKLLFFGIFVNALFVLIFAQSRACLIGFIVSLSLLFIIKKKYLYLISIVSIILIIILFKGMSPIKEDIHSYYKRGQNDKQFESWSGRKPAWEFAFVKFKESPVLGYGMAAGVRFGGISDEFAGSHLHNSYFEVLLNSGLIGFIPWFLCLIITSAYMFKNIVKPKRWFSLDIKKYNIELFLILVFFLVRSIAGTTFVVYDNTFIIYVSIIIYASYIHHESMRYILNNNIYKN